MMVYPRRSREPRRISGPYFFIFKDSISIPHS